MAGNKRTETIEDLLQRGAWAKARTALEKERAKDPENHWVLTQLGVTLYEEQRYQEAIPLFLASLKIVADCPLTLWNLAGTLDALGKTAEAIPIYAWLLESDKSPEEDPCWESKEWAESLKADCVYRLGVCFEHLGEAQKAEECYRQYLNLLLSGIRGTYSDEEVMRRIRLAQDRGNHNGEDALRAAINAMQRATGIKAPRGRRRKPPVMEVP